MIETGAYGERMAGYLRLAEPPISAASATLMQSYTATTMLSKRIE
jgi:hypothetical protein